VAKCLRCQREFEPRKLGHVFCKRECRHKGPRREGDAVPPSEEDLARLFDPERDPEGRVAADDWHPAGKDPPWVELDLCQTIAGRRRWFRRLVEESRL
jgi:hypothetical protein